MSDRLERDLVHLRPLRLEDGARVLAWRNSPEVAAHMYTDHRIEAEAHARWLDGVLQAQDRIYWIIELDGLAVGLADVIDIDRGASRCAWAYYLADPSCRGRGVGSCVEYLVLRHVFERLGLNKLWCEVLAHNEAVWRLHERFGFVREAVLRAHVRKGDRWADVIGLGMLASEWPHAKAAAEARLAAKGYDLAGLTLEAPGG